MHLILSGKKEVNSFEKFWHLRWALKIAQITRNKAFQKTVTEVIALETNVPEDQITNDQTELDWNLDLLRKEHDHPKTVERCISAYHILSIGDFTYKDAAQEKLEPLFSLLALKPYPLMLMKHDVGLDQFEAPKLKVGSFGSCLSPRILTALKVALNHQMDLEHTFHIKMCRSDYLLDAVFLGNFCLTWKDITAFVKKSDVTDFQILGGGLGNAFTDGSRIAWEYPPSKIEPKTSIEDRLRNKDYNLILFDDYADIKFRLSRFKSDSKKYMFLRPEDVKGQFNNYFILEEEKPDVQVCVENFYRIFDETKSRYPKAKIVFLHFPFNNDPNKKLKERAHRFKEAFTPPAWVRVIDVPAEEADYAHDFIHFKPWYYESLARQVYDVLTTPE